jgi:hypothetical protein
VINKSANFGTFTCSPTNVQCIIYHMFKQKKQHWFANMHLNQAIGLKPAIPTARVTLHQFNGHLHAIVIYTFGEMVSSRFNDVRVGNSVFWLEWQWIQNFTCLKNANKHSSGQFAYQPEEVYDGVNLTEYRFKFQYIHEGEVGYIATTSWATTLIRRSCSWFSPSRFEDFYIPKTNP